MPDDATELPTTRVAFRGAAELEPAWRRFVSHYAGRPGLSGRVEGTRLLEELAFGSGAAGVAAVCAQDESGLMQARNRIGDAAMALSGQSRLTEMRPLHKAIVASLISQWTQLEQKEGLEQPPRPGGQDRALREKAENLLRTPEGALLSGTLRLAHNWVIQTAAARAQGRFKRYLSFDEAVAAAQEVFDTSLRNYRQGRDCAFSSYLETGMRLYLPHFIQRGHRRCRKAGVRDTLYGDLAWAGTKPGDSPDSVIAGEDRERLRATLDRLSAQDRDVLTLRFGLDDGQCHTLDKVAERLGVTKQRVKQIEDRALSRCLSLFPRVRGSSAPPLDRIR